MVVTYLALLVVINFFQNAVFASFNNCRLLKGDVLLYHRRIKQDTTKHINIQFASYPEILLDKPGLTVISCIACKDMSLKKKDIPESECKIIAGGIGHTFVKFALSSSRNYGHDFDIKVHSKTVNKIRIANYHVCRLNYNQSMMQLIDYKNIGTVYVCPTVPILPCDWEGNAVDMLEHILCAHQELLLESNSFGVNIFQNNENRYIIATDSGLFLVKIKTRIDNMTIHIQLRYLSYDNSGTNSLRYGIEVFCDSVGFTNKSACENYNPVYNSNDGVEVDLKTMELIIGHRVLNVLITINLYKNSKEYINCLSSKELKSIKTVTEDDIESLNGNCSSPNLCFASDDETVSNIEHSDWKEEDEDDCLNNKNITDINKPLEAVNFNFISEHLLECVNCKCNMIPPIHVCPNRHNVCYACRSGICHICNKAITNIRNIYLEDYSKTFKHRCRYEPQGCTQLYTYNEIRKHELQCVNCLYKCELCMFEGKLAEIGTHFRIAHPSTKIYETMSGIRFHKGSNFIILNNLGVFYCMSSATDIYITWEVIYCGPKERFFSCKVAVSGKKQNHPTKHYYLIRKENIYRWCVTWDELKNANVKEKYAMLYVLTY
ncbi:hypothetical protein RN001_004954 [Aquatica leii]|uniref:SIAH-type domain-containing protein n=1 Tax=Aquatica leii TaxID=1421715 RepID=A0AAN7P5Z5_9COLE|nr:hypothetical protein RN001_004954 [Aquatica leii]